jgi:Peptidase inhibitor I9
MAPDGGARRRRWLQATVLALSLGGHAVQASDAPRPTRDADTFWLDLTEPVPASAANPAAARRQRERLLAQQARVGEQLKALGIEELGRVQHARNAIAVRLTPEQAKTVRAFPDVRRISPATGLHPPAPMG